jgi:hypothetical protein
VTVPSRILRAGLAALLWASSPVSAHRTDEYLQAVLIGIEPTSVLVDLALTPGSGMSIPLLRLMDPDGDDVVSEDEGRRYAQSIGRDIVLRLDGKPLDPGPAEFFFAGPASVRKGTGTSRLVWKVNVPPMPPGEHRLEWRNRHLPGLSVYLANALQPESPRLAVLRQDRSTNQSELEVRFRLEPEPGSTSATGDPGGSAQPSAADGGRPAGFRPAWFLVAVCFAAAAIPSAILLRRGRRR